MKPASPAAAHGFLIPAILVSAGIFPSAPSGSTPSPVLFAMPPLNLQDTTTLSIFSSKLDEAFAKRGFKTISIDAAMEKYAKAEKDFDDRCRAIDCAVEIGRFLGSDYVLLGTLTRSENLYAYQFRLVEMERALIAWTRHGEVDIPSRFMTGKILGEKFQNMTEGLDPKSLLRDRVPHAKTVGLFETGPESVESRIAFDRLKVLFEANPRYAVPDEAQISSRLDLPPGARLPPRAARDAKLPPDSVEKIGKALKADYLLLMELEKEKKARQLHLALYETYTKSLVSSWSFGSPSFEKILKYETGLFGKFDDRTGPKGMQTAGTGLKWKWIAAPLLLASGAVSGYLAYNRNRQADESMEKYRMALSAQDIKRYKNEGESAQKMQYVFGSAGVLCLGASIALLVF